jgi:AAA domain
VLASLVRSNEEAQIGFLKDAPRVNVLISRARDCLILVGNADCLRAGSEGTRTWATVLQGPAPPPDKRGASAASDARAGLPVLWGLPACCERHGTEVTLECPKDFQKFAPAGGCTVPCGATRACGHKCPHTGCHADCFPHGTCHVMVDCMCAFYPCCATHASPNFNSAMHGCCERDKHHIT